MRDCSTSSEGGQWSPAVARLLSRSGQRIARRRCESLTRTGEGGLGGRTATFPARRRVSQGCPSKVAAMSTTVLPPPVLGDRRPSPPPASSDPQARRSALTRFVVGREEEARWVRPALLGLLAAHRRPLPLGPRRVGLGQQLLLGRRAGRDEELEGVLLRLVRRRELHHRRQAAGVAVGDGRCRPGSSASTRGASSCPRRSRASPRSALLYADGAALVHARPPACSPARCWRSRRSPR